MVLKLDDKKTIVTEIARVAKNAISAVAVDYRGLTVSEITELRANARKQNVYVKVIRNTLARRALEGTDYECMNEILVGPMMIAFTDSEPSAPAKLMRDFAKAHDKLTVKGLSIGGKLLSAEDLEIVAKLPTRDEALATLMALMKAPVEKFVRALAEPHSKLVRTIAAIRDQKEQAA